MYSSFGVEDVGNTDNDLGCLSLEQARNFLIFGVLKQARKQKAFFYSERQTGKQSGQFSVLFENTNHGIVLNCNITTATAVVDR
jgi:hypothetical protein